MILKIFIFYFPGGIITQYNIDSSFFFPPLLKELDLKLGEGKFNAASYTFLGTVQRLKAELGMKSTNLPLLNPQSRKPRIKCLQEITEATEKWYF